MITPSQPIVTAIPMRAPIPSFKKKHAATAVKVGYVNWMTVAEAKGNVEIASKTQNKAEVPSNPLAINNFFLCPQGEISALFSMNLVIERLIRALIKTISETGSLPFKCLTQTLIKLNAKALPTSAQ